MAQQLTFKRYNTTSALTSAKTTFKAGDIIFDEEAKIIYVVIKKGDTDVTLAPYYGNNAIKSVSCNSATITVTLSNGTTSSFTVNNVATAGEATKATNDSENNPINTTYFKKSGGTINGATTINGGLTATGETDVESLTAGSLIVSGSTRFNNDVIAATFTGNLKGNADTATSAITAGTASKLSSNAGSATLPVYFTSGAPKAINTTGVGISITGSAAKIATVAGTSNVDRPVFFGYEGDTTRVVYDNDFLYNPSTNTLKIGTGTLTATQYSGNAATSSACTGNSATATRASSVGTDDSIKLYAQYSNEINFGGTSTNGTLHFGFRATDSRPVPTSFIFSNGTATLTANGFKKKDSSDSYVLTGGGGHSKISDLSVGYAATSGACSGNAATATKLNNALTIGGVSYNGSEAKTITAATLGLSSALLFLGTTTTALSDGSTTNPITINNASVTAKTGNVVLYNHLEFIWNGSSWEELGDEKSFALKSVQIKAGSGLTGGGTLEATRTISHADTSSQASITTGGRTYINSITLDGYGHVTALGTGTETNQTDISGNAATATTATTASYLTFVDKREDYPGNIVTSGRRIGGSFMRNSTLGISNNGSFSDAIIIRGYADYHGGSDNALIFNKGTTNVWHTQFTFGSTDSWGTPILFLDTNNYNSYAPKLDGTGATGTWGINISGNAATSSACTGNSATATKAEYAVGTTLTVGWNTLINAGFLASDYTSRYDTNEFLKAFVKWAQTNYSGRAFFGVLNPSSVGYFFIHCYGSGFNSNTGYPEHCTGRYYAHGGISYIFGTSYGTYYMYTDVSSANISSQSVSYATTSGSAISAGSVPWSGITSKPTTLAGYGITDALPLAGGTLTGAVTASSFIKSSGTASQFLMADGSVATKKNLTSVTHSGWSNATTDAGLIPTMNTIAFWNGAFDSSGNSNLAYLDNFVYLRGATSRLRFNNNNAGFYIESSASYFRICTHNASNAYQSIRLDIPYSGAIKAGSSVEISGDLAVSSNVNVTNQTKSKTFSINGGCTLEYDSTNKCVKFVF